MSIGGYKYSYGFKIPASSRVLALDLHPVKDWILIAEESYTALLWNYTQKTVLQVYGKSILHTPDPAGLIKDVKFWDLHVLRWKWLHPGIDVELDAFQGNSVKKRWVVIAMEYKIVFIDYNTGETNSILLSQLDGKTITCVEILDSTYIAIGHADGSIRIWDTLQWSRVKTFPKGTHFKGITHLLSFSQNLRQRAFLLSASGDGVIGVWNVDTCTTLPAYKIPVGKPAHDSMIYNISFDAGLMNLVTVGSDKYINVWNVLNSTELNRFKNIKDSYGKTAVNARHWRHPLFEEGTLIMHGKSSQVYLLSSTSQVNKKKANLEIILDLRSKYNDKTVISDIRIHPLNPSLLFILTQDGIYTLLFEAYILPPAALHSSHTSNIPPKQLQDAVVNSHFSYIARGNQLYSVLYCRGEDGKIISQDIALCTFKRNYGSSVQLKLSASGLYLAVHSVKTGMFEMFRIPNSGPNAPPESIKLGSASELVWHSSLDIFAVISPIGEDDTIGSFIGKVCYTLVLIYEINKRGQVALIYRDEHLNNPVRIFGGPLLGISHGEEVNNTQLYFWENMQPVGDKLPEPQSIYWDENFCILAYKSEYYLYATKPKFEFISRVGQQVISGVWCNSVFFYNNGKEICWIAPPVEFPTILSSNQPDITSDILIPIELPGLKEDKLITKMIRKPAEPITILGIWDGSLLIYTSASRIVEIPLTNPFLQFCLLLGSHLILEALAHLQKLDKSLYSMAARCMEIYGYPQQALSILSYPENIYLAVRHNLPIIITEDILSHPQELQLYAAHNKSNPEILQTLLSLLQSADRHEEACIIATYLGDSEVILDSLMKAKKYGRAYFLADQYKNHRYNLYSVKAQAEDLLRNPTF